MAPKLAVTIHATVGVGKSTRSAMEHPKLYRYTSNGEGIWSAGKRLLPENLVKEVLEAKKWMPKPELPPGEYRFYLTEEGKGEYEKTLLLVHKKYLTNIECVQIDMSTLGDVVYSDKWQVVTKQHK